MIKTKSKCLFFFINTIVLLFCITAILQASKAETFRFHISSKFGDRDVFEFNIKQSGTITAVAYWTWGARELTLILNGPGKSSYYVRINGKSPLKLSYSVSKSHIKKGSKWKISVVNFSRKSSARGSIKIDYPSKSSFALISSSKFKKKISPKTKPISKKMILSSKFINSKVTVKTPFVPVHLKNPALLRDIPVIHPLNNFYQYNKDYEEMFSQNGRSMLCGPTALSSVMYYLKNDHNPKYDKIGQSFDKLDNEDGWVPLLFQMCDTDPETGTKPQKIIFAAKILLKRGKYKTNHVKRIGLYKETDEKRAVKTSDLKKASTIHKDQPDKGVILHFGWYLRNFENGKWIFIREGGHYVSLAGYSRTLGNVFFIADPAVDYTNMEEKYSRIELTPLPEDTEAPENVGLYTMDIVQNCYALLEEMIIISP